MQSIYKQTFRSIQNQAYGYRLSPRPTTFHTFCLSENERHIIVIQLEEKEKSDTGKSPTISNKI